MPRIRRMRGIAALTAVVAAIVMIAAPARADFLDASDVAGSGTYTGTLEGAPVTGDLDVDLTCVFVVCFGSVKVDGAGGLTIGFSRTPEAPYELWLSGIQISFGGPTLVTIGVVSLKLNAAGAFSWETSAGVLVGQLDSGGFTIG